MGEVTGPIWTLPGARHDFPDGTKCDVHPDRDAVARVQGETDSFGCEMSDCCQECLDEIRSHERSAKARTGNCDWCKQDAADIRETRDYEEGLCGPVYRVCGPCRKRRDDEDGAALDQYHDDSHAEDDYDPGEDCGRWDNGRLGSVYWCRLAGTEFCDFECPYRSR